MVKNKKVKDITLMTLEETADLLKIGKSTLYKMVREKKIPGIKIGRQWRFKSSDIEIWLEKNKNFIIR